MPMTGGVSPILDPAAQPDMTLVPTDSEGELRYRELIELSPDAVFILCDGVCVYINPVGVNLFGAASARDLLGKRLLDLIRTTDAPDLLERIRQLPLGELLPRSEETFVCLDGSLVDIEMVGRALTFHHQPAIQVIAYDITERKQAQAHLHYLAYYDQLTGLPNRALFDDRLNQALMQAKRYGQHVAVLAIEPDHFQQVNTIYGHQYGDQLLQELAGRMQSVVRECDTVARSNGHGFYLLLTKVDGPAQVEMVTARLLSELAQPCSINAQTIHLSVSIGGAIYPTDAAMFDTLMQHAEMAMSRAQLVGNTYLPFSRELSARLTHLATLEEQLRQAIDRDEFVVYFQPQVELATSTIVSSEALVRWNHPDGRVLTAGEFIESAEQANLIETLDEIVLRQTCQLHQAWRQAGLPSLRVACNLSARQFRHHKLVDRVTQVLDTTGFPPDLLELEITEQVAMEDVEHTLNILRRLRELGIRLLVDDFGTGYSSLNYLKRFPVQTIKIDRSFINDLQGDTNGGNIVTAIIRLSHALQMQVIAEGVEVPYQCDFLRAEGCDMLQGYLISHALSPDAFRAYLDAHLRDGRYVHDL